jgi:hypothetical protein
LTEKNWEDKIRKIKEATDQEIEENRVAEQRLREKYADEKPEIIEMLRSELGVVVKVFKQPSGKYYDQPRLEVADWGASLKVPIVRAGDTVNIGITFSFQFSDDGYGLKVVKDTYDAVTQKSDEISAEILPPVTIVAVQKQVTEFLETRKACIKRMEEEAQRLQRER